MSFVWGLRWLLAILSAPLGFYVALFIGLSADGFVASFCSPERIVSGLCTATWYVRAGDAITIFGAALAGVLVVLFPTLLAPERRLVVAMTFYILGAAAALLMVSEGGTFDLQSVLPVAAALSAGALALLVVRRFLSERPAPRR